MRGGQQVRANSDVILNLTPALTLTLTLTTVCPPPTQRGGRSTLTTSPSTSARRGGARAPSAARRGALPLGARLLVDARAAGVLSSARAGPSSRRSIATASCAASYRERRRRRGCRYGLKASRGCDRRLSSSCAPQPTGSGTCAHAAVACSLLSTTRSQTASGPPPVPWTTMRTRRAPRWTRRSAARYTSA